MTVYTETKFDDYVLVRTAVYISYTSYTREIPIRTSSGHFFLHRRVFATRENFNCFRKEFQKSAQWEIELDTARAARNKFVRH